MEKLDQEEALGRMAGFSPINLFQPTLSSHHVILSNGILVDLEIRQQFSFGNHCYLLHARYESMATSLKLQTDSVGGSDFGCGVYFARYWHHLYWPDL